MQSKTLFLLGLCTIFSTTVSALPLDSKVKTAVKSGSKTKVFQGKIDLDALVSNDSNDLIVEYNIPSSSVPSGLERRSYIATNKRIFRQGLIVPAVYKYFGITITCLWLLSD